MQNAVQSVMYVHTLGFVSLFRQSATPHTDFIIHAKILSTVRYMGASISDIQYIRVMRRQRGQKTGAGNIFDDSGHIRSPSNSLSPVASSRTAGDSFGFSGIIPARLLKQPPERSSKTAEFSGGSKVYINGVISPCIIQEVGEYGCIKKQPRDCAEKKLVANQPHDILPNEEATPLPKKWTSLCMYVRTYVHL